MDIAELLAWLGGPHGLYVLPDGPASAVHGSEGHYLVKDGDHWLVCYSERGRTSGMARHATEHDACLDALDRLGPAYGALLRPPGAPAPKPLLARGATPVDLQVRLSAEAGDDLREAVRSWLTATTARLYGAGFANHEHPFPRVTGDRFERDVRLRLSALTNRRAPSREHRGGDWLGAFDADWTDAYSEVSLSTSAFARDGRLAVHEIQAHHERDGRLVCTAVRYGGGAADEAHRWTAFLTEQAALRRADYGHVGDNAEHPRRARPNPQVRADTINP
jgi:hypothetical protein